MAGGDTVKVPIIGQTNKATLFIAGLAGVGALGYAYWKKKKAAATTTPGTTSGYGYGSQYAYGYGAQGYEPYGYGYGPFGLGAYGGSGNYGYGYYGAGTEVPEEVPSQASTNAEWSEACVSALTNQGFAGQDVLSALGLYLTGSPMSALQVQIVQAAIAAEGYPPVAGANGYPPAINSGGTTGGGQTGTTPAGGGTGTGTTGTGTGSTGTTGATGTTSVRAPGMPSTPTASKVTTSGFTLSWPKTPGATSYRVRVTYQQNLVWQNTTSGTSINVTGLTADHTYTAHVAASNAGGTSSETNGPTVHTTK
jgi:Fibronectin type III domain